MKTYAYVTTETCRNVSAEKPGAFIGRDEIPVSKHGDYTPWFHGKRETKAIITSYATPANRWKREAAREVAALHGWFPMGEL